MGEFADLKITQGGVEVDLLDNVNFMVKHGGWGPAVPSRNISLLGGRGVYEDVPETIEVDIFGTDAADVLEALQKVSYLLDQANAWANGEDVDPVILSIRAQGSVLVNPLQVMISGRPSQDSGFLFLPTNFSERISYAAEIEGLQLRFKRRGQLLGEEETESYSGTVNNNEVVTVDGLEELDIASPTKVALTGFSGNTDLMGSGFLMVTGVTPNTGYAKNLYVYAVSDMTSTEFSSVADTTNKAVGGTVFRIDASTDQSGTITISDINAEIQSLTIFIALRNNHTSTTWKIRPRTTGLSNVTGKWQVIDASTQNPRAIALEMLTAASPYHGSLHLDFITDASVGTLDVNRVATLPHDENTHYIGITEKSYTNTGYAHDLIVDPRPLTHRRPLAYIATSES